MFTKQDDQISEGVSYSYVLLLVTIRSSRNHHCNYSAAIVHLSVCFHIAGLQAVSCQKMDTGSLTSTIVFVHGVHEIMRQVLTSLHKCLLVAIEKIPRPAATRNGTLVSKVTVQCAVANELTCTHRICVMILTVWIIHCLCVYVCVCVCVCVCSLCDLQFSQLVL